MMSPDAMVAFRRQYVADSLMRASPLEVTVTNPSGGEGGGLTDTQLRAAPVPVSGSFYPATQPISGTVSVSGSVAVSGPLTDTQLRASAVPVSLASMPSTPVTGPLTDTQLRASAVPISGTVGVSGTVTVSGPLTDTQLRASAVPVSGPLTDTQMRATPVPISGTVTITPPTLTKGTQAATGLSVQNLKDAGRTTLAMTAEFTFAQTAETLLTMTLSANGAATSTFSSRVITNGKKLRLQSAIIQVELLGSGTAPQRAYLRMRANTAGATATSSPLQWILPVGATTAIVKGSNWASMELPDGFELSGDGTATFGFSLETPDWVATTATGRAKITVIGYEY